MTTDNLPAVVEPERALASVDSWIPVLADVANLAQRIAGTEFVPKGLRDSAPAVAAAILYGREVGLPPMTALSVTHVIEGKPAISAEGMRAMVYAAGHEIEVTESTGAQCIARGRRRGSDHWTTVAWSIDMARAAGVAGKQVWQRYPRAMLQARATAELCRLVFPDVTHGFRAVEELDDTLEDGTPATPPGPGTKVTRARKTAAKKSTPAPLEERGERPALTGPPLPGEDGYEPGEGVEDHVNEATHTIITSAGEDAPGAVVGPVERSAPSPADAQTTDNEICACGGGGGADHDEGCPNAPEETSGGDGAHDEEQPEPSPTETEEPPGASGGEAPKPGGSKDPPPRNMSRAQQRGIEAALTHIGVDNDREERHLIATTILGRLVESFKSLTFDEASTLIETFARIETKEQLTVLLDEFDARRTAEADRWNEGDRS